LGYRLYFYVVPKDIVQGIQQTPTLRHAIMVAHPERNPDFEEDDEFVSVYEIDQSYTGFEFGKYMDGDYFEHIVGDNSEKLKWFNDGDGDAIVGDAEMVKRAIEWERDRIVENQREDAEDKEKAFETAKSRYRWSKDYLVDLNMDRRELTTSWLYEHQIYNLVLLYKNTDWDKYSIVFAGW